MSGFNVHALSGKLCPKAIETLRLRRIQESTLPKGTHQWSSFLTPEELALILERASISVQEMAGFVYNPLTGRWSLSDDVNVNFIAYATKIKTANL
ncbi:ubiquinone biosynthesis O-methyltransferase mitochondrial [Prunus yedoensis var. nudiflora]|uniref:Ubiquinone biosynthesis O-methyltransferase mitochondrial n=1 Tax=Prunus yedoensis var. nudiflora TaxID=2094558 RepID=A0A315AHL6_PRUYE|nr:ubiquinone biosynthesis O-methyltransferase mitochondrial [Prunus yedoensis var. nudiflora]